jgi:hypothetical protein
MFVKIKPVFKTIILFIKNWGVYNGS